MLDIPPPNALDGLRLTVLTSGHAPDDERVFFKEARSLVRHGAEVTMIYPDSKLPPARDGGVRFRPFAGSRAWSARWHGRRRLAEVAAQVPADVMLCHEPDSLCAGLQAARHLGAKVVYDSHECWGASFAQRFPRAFWRPSQWLFQRWERGLIRRADAAIGATWPITEYLRPLLPERPVHTLLNVPVADDYGEVPARMWEESTILVHDGSLGFDRGLKTMVQAVEELARRHKVVLRIVGDVFDEPRAWLERYVAEHRLQSVVQRTGWRPYEEVGQNIATGHVGLIALQDLPNNRFSLPNKLFNYLLYGLPVVLPSFVPTFQRLVAEDRCGILAESASPTAYAAALTRLIENREETLAMGQRALTASQTKYQWRHMEPVLVNLVAGVSGRSRAAAA